MCIFKKLQKIYSLYLSKNHIWKCKNIDYFFQTFHSNYILTASCVSFRTGLYVP